MRGTRVLESLGVSSIVLAAVLSGSAGAWMFVDGVRSGENSAAAAVESVAHLRSHGEAPEFDARVGALRVASNAENPRLGRALAAIAAIRRIEEQSGRSAATDEAMALGLDEARAAAATNVPSVSAQIGIALAASGCAFSVPAGVLVVAGRRRRRAERKRIALCTGLDVDSSDLDGFTDEVLLAWIRRSARHAGDDSRSDEGSSKRVRLAAVESAPPTAESSSDQLASSFRPSRRQ